MSHLLVCKVAFNRENIRSVSLDELGWIFLGNGREVTSGLL